MSQHAVMAADGLEVRVCSKDYLSVALLQPAFSHFSGFEVVSKHCFVVKVDPTDHLDYFCRLLDFAARL